MAYLRLVGFALNSVFCISSSNFGLLFPFYSLLVLKNTFSKSCLSVG